MLTWCIKANPAASSRDKRSFGVPWTVFSNTNVQSSPGTSRNWEQIWLCWGLLPPFFAAGVWAEGKLGSRKFNAISVILISYWACVSAFCKYYAVKQEHETLSDSIPALLCQCFEWQPEPCLVGNVIAKNASPSELVPCRRNLSLSQNLRYA